MSEAMTHHITERLRATFSPTLLEVVDESHLHAGHRGAAEHGGGHYRVTVESEQFRGMNALARHRAVYGLFREELKGAIHALAITARAPGE